MTPTENMIDDMFDGGMTLAQIADYFGCDKSRISKMRSKISRGVEKDYSQDAITAEEIERAKRIEIGDTVTVANRFKMRSGDEMAWGVTERHKVVGKFRHIVLLDNGASVDYAEVAMQARRAVGKR